MVKETFNAKETFEAGYEWVRRLFRGRYTV